MLLHSIAAADPTVTALDDGRRAIGYGALRVLLDMELGWLAGGGAERVALLADNGVSWALADLALHAGKRVCVPLPGSFTDALKLHALDDAGIDTLLTDDPDRARTLLPGWRSDGAGPASGLVRFRRGLDASSRPGVPRGTRKVTYTSGSTSRPKGVCLAGESLEAVARAVADATAGLPIERHLCLLPLATLLENVAGLYAPLLRGATCLLPSCGATGMSYTGLDATRLLGVIALVEPHSLILVPELLQVLVAAAERGWRVPDSLRFVAVGGARVSSSLLERADAAGIPAFEGYGLSECASVVCLNSPDARRAGTVGRPLPHVRVRVDDQGQVHVAGNTMLGYLGDRPLHPDAEFATGDLGEFDGDGYLRLRGRVGNRFITSFGRNVSPEWIESEVSQRLDSRPVLAFGEARPYVVVLVGADVAEADDRAVTRAIAAANAALPDYAQVRRWARTDRPFSHADGTLTANGRLRRTDIHARHADLIRELYAEALAS
ncbi:MAG TPA: AMP-binding protein [Steroidobacteraceae bacterium]|nr:AMP-binding protein [Steroidobacteraceae bacterium]